jgi:F0F1-type ATP synthase delta subunit
MRYTPRHYAEALYLAIKETSPAGKTKILKQFLSVVQKHNDWRKIHAILHSFEKVYLEKEGLRTVMIEYVDVMPKGLKEAIARQLGSKLIFEERRDSELYAGVRIFVNNEILIDASARRILQAMFAERQ